jgi:hypothetical protein
MREWQRTKRFFDEQRKNPQELHAEKMFRRMRETEHKDGAKPLNKTEFLNTEIEWVNSLKFPPKTAI